MPHTRRQLIRTGLQATLLGTGAVILSPGARAQAAVVTADLVVYGATPGGLAAAIQFRRSGGSAVVVDAGNHVGGMTTAGLGATDTGNTAAIGGLSHEFYRRVYGKYNGTPVTASSPARFTFEPHVAAAVFTDLLAEAGVTVHLGRRLATVTKAGNRITELSTEDGQVYRGLMYVDASYEGDLLAKAGVASTVGREGNATYGESINGVQLRDKHQFTKPVDPYVTPGNPASGLLPGVSAAALAPNGTADGRIQAYNFRMCLTGAAGRVPFPRPAGYDAGRYALLLRYIEAGYTGPFFNAVSVGGGKTDSNNDGAFSTDDIGMNAAYPTASFAARDTIVAEHRTYQQGLMWFLSNDTRVPAAIRSATAAWGLAPDEFTATGNWPPMLYVREARRMVSAYVMTEHNCRGATTVADSVGLASYTMDSHNCQRLVVGGVARNEGDVQVGVPGPYQVSYRSIVPLEAQCANLLVPVCLSASHIAYGSIRMEPVFMVLGQSAAVAARLAITGAVPVQQVNVTTLQGLLRDLGQRIDISGNSEIVIDSRSGSGVTRAGTWLSSTSIGGYYGSDYEHDGNTAKGVNRLRYTPALPAAGAWTVQLRWTAHANRASNVPVDVVHGGGLSTLSVDQRASGGQWVPLGTFQFTAGSAGSVLIRTEQTDGYVIADAARFVRA
ncbi:FAD-dependent oxidoreductase [Dactylosporangium sp. NPDC049525]|uniref:FAD-dependent oxidoreductase n=1 Tax=Dactylosporangium sp. NPDC049525 TaxID=3154730 RepID=UPI00343D536D